MEIILKQDVEKLGYKNDIVSVKAGYGVNFLIPQGVAVLATKSNKKILAENLKQQSHKAAKEKQEAQVIADKLTALKLTIGAKAGESGKIFGAVNTIQLADAIKAKGVELDRKVLKMKEDSIKNVGSYTATARLHREITVEINFEVIAE
tara:strand:- start:53807 stop:54253 length:447 start_codon:yes stop_codon:yes gene_type:complete